MEAAMFFSLTYPRSASLNLHPSTLSSFCFPTLSCTLSGTGIRHLHSPCTSLHDLLVGALWLDSLSISPSQVAGVC